MADQTHDRQPDRWTDEHTDKNQTERERVGVWGVCVLDDITTAVKKIHVFISTITRKAHNDV